MLQRGLRLNIIALSNWMLPSSCAPKIAWLQGFSDTTETPTLQKTPKTRANAANYPSMSLSCAYKYYAQICCKAASRNSAWKWLEMARSKWQTPLVMKFYDETVNTT
jgi:hypothetical protein